LTINPLAAGFGQSPFSFVEKMMEFWKRNRWHLTLFPCDDGTERYYIITRKGEIKVYLNQFFAHEALCNEYPIEEETE